MIALAASAFPWPGNQNPQQGYYYRSILSGSCYCAPMICVLAPHAACPRPDILLRAQALELAKAFARAKRDVIPIRKGSP